MRGKYNPIPSPYSRSLHELVDKLLIKDYRKRPTIEDILNYESIQEKMKLYGYSAPAPHELKIDRGK